MEQQITEAQVEALGFEIVNEYPHDQFFTRVYGKGMIQVDFTYKNYFLQTVDLSIEEGQCLPFQLDHLTQLVQAMDGISNLMKK